jgi:hypothetical protein
MKLFMLLLIFSFPLMAQIETGSGTANCTQANLAAGGNIQCGDLTITGPYTFPSGIPALDVQVVGDVTISGNVFLNGTDAPNADGTGFAAGGVGGPGAGNGGSPNFGTPENGVGVSGGGAGNTGACGSGGGGGGFALAGTAGIPCAAAVGGLAGSAFTNIFSDTFRGGFGGGAGGNAGGASYGPGGGGGGAIRIRAGGNIIINGNISANGGKGGDSGSINGAGGGGSGGLIWFQALGNITLNANVFVSGGPGGDGATTFGGNGSSGGRGAIRFEDLDGVIGGTGSLPGFAQVNGFSSAGSKLNSSISCGMIGTKDQAHLQFSQLFFGFILALGFSFAFKQSSKLFT